MIGLTVVGKAGRHRDDFVARLQPAVAQLRRSQRGERQQVRRGAGVDQRRIRGRPKKRAKAFSNCAAKRPVVSQKSSDESTSDAACPRRRTPGPTPAPASRREQTAGRRTPRRDIRDTSSRIWPRSSSARSRHRQKTPGTSDGAFQALRPG